jgi:Zn-dependent alcohol dehydrogenase
MGYTARAVVTRANGQLPAVETISVDGPAPGEVTIKLAACGVCHSDLSATDGTIPLPPPLVLGHEGAGTVVEVGQGVTDFAVGDTVVSSYITMCGRCRYCAMGRPELCDLAAKAMFTLPDGTVRTRDAQGQPLNVFTGCGVMAEYATLHTGNVVKLDPQGAKMECCALISCGVMTGWGAACNAARVRPGSICVVFGAGGVGLNALQGCAMSGAAMVVAVDRSDDKLALAKVFGATHTLNAGSVEDVVKALKKLTGGGADYALECVGSGAVVAQAYGCLRKGGVAVAVGVAKATDTTTIRTNSLTFEEKTLTGSNLGGARPREDFPRLLGLYRAGRLKLDELITRRYTIDEAPQAFDDLANGRNARGMIVF